MMNNVGFGLAAEAALCWVRGQARDDRSFGLGVFMENRCQQDADITKTDVSRMPTLLK